MTLKPDIFQALRVSRKVVNYGQLSGDSYLLDGLQVNKGESLDQFVIRDDKVALNIHFHNDFHLDYKDRAALSAFLKKIRALDSEK